MTEPDADRVINRSLIITTAAALAVMLVLATWAYVRLPADALVPTSWTLDGRVDGYAGKLAGLFLPVVLFPVIIGVLFVVPMIEPRKINLVRSAAAFRATAYALIGFFVALHALIVAAALGYELEMGRVLLVGIGALLVVTGNWMPKIRSNFLFGIRTPWTLTSDHTWRRTHRVGGRVLLGFGLAMMIGAALFPIGSLQVLFGVAGAVVALGLVAYSYVVWRSAPDVTRRER
jgi:immunity protein, SdpI family